MGDFSACDLHWIPSLTWQVHLSFAFFFQFEIYILILSDFCMMNSALLGPSLSLHPGKQS